MNLTMEITMINYPTLKFPPVNLLVLMSASAFLTACGSNPLSNTEEDVAIQKAYYSAVEAVAKKPSTDTLVVKCPLDSNCVFDSITYNSPLKQDQQVQRVLTSSEVSGKVAEKIIKPITDVMSMGLGVAGAVFVSKTIAENSGSNNTNSRVYTSGDGNTSSASLTPTSDNSVDSSVDNSIANNDNNSQVDNSATATPTVVNAPAPVIVDTKVVDPVVVNPEIVNPVIIRQ